VKVWITGASGMLGTCVARRLDALGQKWIGSDLEIDITDRSTISAFLEQRRPTAIVNCAAYTAVDAAETDENAAILVNGTGPTLLAEFSRQVQATFIHVSTDYVFDGDRPGALHEDAQLGPCNAYGRSKLVGEQGVVRVCEGEGRDSSSGAPWHIVRTSWLFGAGRSSFVETMWKLLLEREELRVVNDQFGRPTYAQDLADFLVDLLVVDRSRRLASGIRHFANAGPTSWHGFAEEIRTCMSELGESVKVRHIHPVSSAEYPRPARRPRNSVLSTERIEAEGIIPRHWRSALVEYAQQRASVSR